MIEVFFLLNVGPYIIDRQKIWLIHVKIDNWLYFNLKKKKKRLVQYMKIHEIGPGKNSLDAWKKMASFWPK